MKTPPQRTCLACRLTSGAEDLVRLVADPESLVWVDRRHRLPGRGAYVCATRACVERLQRRPAALSRALQQEVVVTGLLERVQEANQQAVSELLSLAARAGCVAGGTDNLARLLPAGGFEALVVASDASPRAVRAAMKLAPALICHPVPWNRQQLGHLVGKGERALLALRVGKPSRSLVRELRRMGALG